MTTNPSITFLKIEDYIGVSINTISNKEKKVLLIIIDNKSLFNDLNLVCQNLPRLVKRNQNYVDYSEISIIYSHPNISSITTTNGNIYTTMSKLLKPSTNNNSIEYLRNLLEYVKIKHILQNKEKIDCICISNSYLGYINDDMSELFKYMNNQTNFVYYDFNILNNINFFNEIQHFNYFNNFKNNDPSIFIEFIKEYSFHSKVLNEIKLEITNGEFICNMQHQIQKKGNNGYFLIDIISNETPVVLKMTIVYHNTDIYECSYEIKDTKVDDNDFLFIEYTLDNILIPTDIDKKNKFKENLNNMKSIVNKRYKLSQNEGKIEISRSLVWMNRYLRTLNEYNLNELIDDKDKHNDVYILATKSQNNIKFSRLKEKFNERLIKNKNMLKSANELFTLDDSVKEFIDIHDIIMENKHPFMKSCETFYSVISVSNWFEELQNGSSIGLMIKIKSDDATKIGIPGCKVTIPEITLSYISIKDYIESIIFHFDKKNNGNGYGNLNEKEIFTGNGIGSSNAVIPMYINTNHWVQAKRHLPYVLGIILAHNPLGYTDNHINFMFYLLSDMTRKTFIENTNFSIMWIKAYLALFRTCSEIAFERNYNKGIKSIVNNYLTDPYKRLVSRPFDNDIIIGQILCTGLKLDNDKLDKFIEFIFEDCIRRKVSSSYKIHYINFLSTLITENKIDELNDEIRTLIEYVDKNIKYAIELLLSFRRMYNILSTLTIEIGGFRKLLKIMDDNYGSVPDDICENIFSKINSNRISNDVSYSDLYKERNIINNPENKILTYILQSIIYGKDKERKKAIIDNKLNIEDTSLLSTIEIVNMFLNNM